MRCDDREREGEEEGEGKECVIDKLEVLHHTLVVSFVPASSAF